MANKGLTMLQKGATGSISSLRQSR